MIILVGRSPSGDKIEVDVEHHLIRRNLVSLIMTSGSEEGRITATDNRPWTIPKDSELHLGVYIPPKPRHFLLRFLLRYL